MAGSSQPAGLLASRSFTAPILYLLLGFLLLLVSLPCRAVPVASDPSPRSCSGGASCDEGSLLQLNRASAASSTADTSTAEARLGALGCLWKNSSDIFRQRLQNKLQTLDGDTLAALLRGVQAAPTTHEAVVPSTSTGDPPAKTDTKTDTVTKAEAVVKTFKASISNDLEASIQADINSDQSALTELAAAFSPCVTTMTELQAKALKEKAAGLKGTSLLSYDSCVTQEKTLISQVHTCKSTMTALTTNKTQSCKLVTSFSESFETMSSCSCSIEKGESYADYLVRQSAHFRTLHQQFQMQQLLCETYTKQLLTVTTECESKQQTLSQKQTECFESKTEMCSKDAAIAATSAATCDAYSACHAAAKLSLESMLNSVKAKQAHRCKEWNSTKALGCFMDDFSKSGAALCKTVTERAPCEVSPVPEIDYPTAPEPKSCTPIISSCAKDVDEKEIVPEVDEKDPLPEVDEKHPLPEVDEKQPLPETDEKEPLPEVKPDEKDEEAPGPGPDSAVVPQLSPGPGPDSAVVPPLPDKLLPGPGPDSAVVPQLSGPDSAVVPQLSCEVTCRPADGAAEIVALPGSTGEGAEAAVSGLSLKECRKLCADEPSCEGIEYAEAAGEAPSTCKGQRDIHTSKCQSATDRTTEIFGAPWGKCMTFGDPHVFGFDRPNGPKMNVFETGEYYLINSSEVIVQGRFGYAKDYPSFASTVGVAVGGPLLEGHNLYVAYIGPTPGWGGFKVFWDDEEILTSLPSEFQSKDGLLSGKLFSVEPTDYHKYARDTIGTWGETLPSYYFTLPGLNMYVLAGYDSANVVIEMQKLSGGQDGICGNFNCDVADDAYDALSLRGFTTPLTGRTLFSQGPAATEVQYKKRKGATRLQDCSHELKAKAANACKAMDEDKEDSCIFDICAAGTTDVAKGEVTTDVVSNEVEKDMAAKEEKV